MDSTNRTIRQVLLGLGVYLIVATIPVLIFTNDKLKGEGGLLFGGVMALLVLISMKWTIDRALHMPGRQSAYMGMISAVRMIIICAVLALIGWFRILNLITVFAGLFGLKFATYMQPLTEKLINKFREKNDSKQ